MSSITTLSVWRDVGYTEGCLEHPSKTSTLPNPTFTFEDLNVSRDKMFSEVQVKGAFEGLFDCSYLKASIDMNNGDDVIVYGWIDNVACSSDTVGSPVSTIYWHIDFWRTYLSKATFGSGIVVRRPGDFQTTNTIPHQAFPYLNYRVTVKQPLIQTTNDDWWVLIRYNTTSSVVTKEIQTIPEGKTEFETTSQEKSNKVVSTAVMCFPINKSNATRYISGGPVPQFTDVVTGKWDEILGILPENIVSAFISPVAPYLPQGNGSEASPYSMGNWTSTQMGSRYVFVNRFYNFDVFTNTISADTATNDWIHYSIAGLDSETIGALPFGMKVNKYDYRIMFESTCAYLQLRLYSETPMTKYTPAHQEGLCYTIPLPALEVTENSWSSYSYSGAQQYNKDQLRMAAEKAAVEGGISIGASALEGAMAGGMMGAMAGGIGAAPGALIGAGTAIVGSSVRTAGMNAYLTGSYNDEMQSIEDRYHASQPDGLLIAGNGFDAIYHGSGGIYLVGMQMDAYSQANAVADTSLYGLHVQEPKTSCQSLIDTGGPLQIINLTVTGSIPTIAKTYFRDQFKGGVRIV